VIICGGFTSLNGVNRTNFARLNANGSLDTSFGASNDTGGVAGIADQPDGKVIIGGSFTIVNGVSRRGIARLNSNGSVDTSFNPGTAVTGYPGFIALQPDGKVLFPGNSQIVR